MTKRISEVAWWLAAVAAGVLLALALLLIAWSVHKPWLPGGLDVHLREVWFGDAVMSAAVSFLLALNLRVARRGQYCWPVHGLISTGILFFLWAIVLPIATVMRYSYPPGCTNFGGRKENIPAAGANFAGRNLQGADLEGCNFAYANLRHANLSGADLRYSYFTSADLTGANFTGAELSHASLSWHTNATRANLTRADLRDAWMPIACLKGASLRDADLRNAHLSDPNDLSWAGKGADLRDADLTGADLRGASLHGAILSGARYDARTRWPPGFDPKRRGAKLIKPSTAHQDSLPVWILEPAIR
jgi:hypothetical protein